MVDEVDGCIDRLQAAVRATGVTVPDSPGNVEALRLLERTIAPLELPPSLRRLWERVSPATLPVGLSPPEIPSRYNAVADPALAVDAWISARDFPGPVPVAVVAVAHWPPLWRFVQLATPGVEGGAVFDWSPGADGLRRRFARVEDWLDATSRVIEEGGAQVERWVVRTGWLALDVARFEALAADDPPFRDRPERWRAAAALHPPPPRDEQTVCEVLWSLPRAGTATVSGRVGLLPKGDRGQRMHVTDGTGLLDVWCPSETHALPLLGHSNACRLTLELGGAGWVPDDRRPACPPHGVVRDMRVRMFG